MIELFFYGKFDTARTTAQNGKTHGWLTVDFLRAVYELYAPQTKGGTENTRSSNTA